MHHCQVQASTKIQLGLVFVWKLPNSNWWAPEANMWNIIVASIWTWILRNCQVQNKRSIGERYRAEMEYSKCNCVISGAICGGRIIRRHKNEGHIIQRRKFGLEPSCHHISDHAMAPCPATPRGWDWNSILVLLRHPSPQLQIWTWELKTKRKIRSPRVCSGTWELKSWTWDLEVDLA